MRDIWQILKFTGGSPDLRVLISATLDKIDGDIHKDTSIYSFQSLYKMMEDFSRSGKSPDMYYMEESIKMFYNGDISSHDLDRLSDAIVKSVIPNSSARVYMDEEEESLSSKRIPTNTKSILYAVYAMLIIFLPYVYFQKTGESFSGGVKQVSSRIISEFSPKIPTIMGSDSIDIPSPLLLHLPPGMVENPSHNDRLLQTPFLQKDQVSNVKLNRYGSRERTGVFDRTFDNYLGKFIKDSVSKVNTDGYELHVRGETKDDQVKEVSMWIEYVLSSVDPAYAPSGNSKLNVLLSDTFPELDKKIFGAIGGLYLPDHDLLYVSKTEDNSGDNVKLDERGRQLKILVHELAHRVHIVSEPVGMECSEHDPKTINPDALKGVCKERPVPVNTEETKGYLDIIRDEVYGVVFLGLHSDNMTLEEASVYLKMILDVRLETIYERAKSSELYEKYRYEYAFTNHREMWAEASASFLYAINPRHFPDRDWIQQNDPQLYSLLTEVYSGASRYTVPEFFSFSGKMNPDPSDP